MSRKNSAPAVLPFRDTNNTEIKYVGAPAASATSTSTYTGYDSDFEPLIPNPAQNLSELSEYDLMHFTATGRPAPQFKASALMSLGAGDAYSLPQLLPRRYTDDSIIPAIVVNIIPSPKPVSTDGEQDTGRRRSIFSKLRGEKKKDDGLIKMKVVYMPRRDYLKYFARDMKGEYVGSEPYRQWTEDELQAAFMQYTPREPKKKGYKVPT